MIRNEAGKSKGMGWVEGTECLEFASAEQQDWKTLTGGREVWNIQFAESVCVILAASLELLQLRE